MGARRLWRLVGCVVGAALLGTVQMLLLGPAAVRSAEDRSAITAAADALSRQKSYNAAAAAQHNNDAAASTAAALTANDGHQPGDVSIGGLDLDARYPSEDAFWARFDAAPDDAGHTARWLSRLRKQAAAAGALRVPEKLHQTWKDANPPKVLFSPRWARSLRENNLGWEYRLWTDAENRALVAKRYPKMLGMYDGYGSAIQRADVARYVIAHAHGGVYADLDTECFKPFRPLLHGVSLVLSYKAGANFSRGACNSIFASAAGHPFWPVVFDVLRNRSLTSLAAGHTAVLYSTGPSVLREALRRLLRLPAEHGITPSALQLLRSHLGIAVLDASVLHPVTADRRTEAKDSSASTRPPNAVCTHHFVSSWVAHDKGRHEETERRRREGDATAAMHGLAQPVLRENTWEDKGGETTSTTHDEQAHEAKAPASRKRKRKKGPR